MRKIGLLITRCSEDGIDLSVYGMAGENENSGNVYIWTENMFAVPYIGLGSDEIWYLTTCPECGDEQSYSELKYAEAHRGGKCESCGKDM
jgi:hypothetical protein